MRGFTETRYMGSQPDSKGWCFRKCGPNVGQYTKPKAIERRLVVNNVTAAQHMVVKVYV